MRTLTVIVVLSLAATGIALLPNADAVGTCSNLRNDGVPPECPHTFCYGTRWSYPNYYYECDRYFDIPPVCSRICTLP